MKKVSLYKFTHILLLKIDAQLKQKNDKKKSNHPNLLKNNKIKIKTQEIKRKKKVATSRKAKEKKKKEKQKKEKEKT